MQVDMQVDMTDTSSERDELAARLQRLEDMAAIHQLFIDYGTHLDNHDFEAYASLFDPDGEVLLGPLGRARGRARIRELMERALSALPIGQSFHLVTNPVVRLDGDTAQAAVMWTVIQRGSDGSPQVAMLGRHVDLLARRDGHWLFLRRAGHIDIPSAYPSAGPAPDSATGSTTTHTAPATGAPT